MLLVIVKILMACFTGGFYWTKVLDYKPVWTSVTVKTTHYDLRFCIFVHAADWIRQKVNPISYIINSRTHLSSDRLSSPFPSNSDWTSTNSSRPSSKLIHLWRFSGYFSLDLFSQSYATCPPRSWCCTPKQNTPFTCCQLKRYPSDDSQFLSVEDSFVEEISMLAWRHDLTLCRVCCVLSCGPQQHTFSMVWRLRTNFICSYSPLTFRSHRFTSLS